MAKAPADTIKYNIYADIVIDGVVDKPDVVGALFGQSEGLLGEELESVSYTHLTLPTIYSV